ncbi:MAG: hypothetical protein H6Q33_4579 [Deltaproteobacteria bacterium]|jgi:hypothetical protein|nr:hypothetical protein [Deltaproteobacteria bacterium]
MSPTARLVLSFFVGLYLLAAVIAPAFAIIWVAPAVGSVITGAAIRAAAGQAARTVPLALGTGAGRAASWAAQSQAANTIGVMAVGTVAFCGTGSVLDVCSNPKFKVRADGAPEPQEEASASIPATTVTTAPINVTDGVPSQTLYQYAATVSGPFVSPTFNSIQEACEGSKAAGNCPTATTFYGTSGAYCNFNKSGGGLVGCGAFQSAGTGCPTGYSNVGGTCTKQDCPAGYTMNSGTCSKLECPSGFTLSGSTCNPVDGMWTPDGSPTFENIGGTWTPHPKDPDIPDGSVTPPNPWNWTGMDEFGNPTQIQLTATPTGGVQIQTWQQGTGGGGTSTVTHNTINIGPTGIWNSATTNVYNGDLATVGNGGGSSPTPQQPLPTDYQKDATGQQTNTKLQTIIDGGVKVKEDGTPTTGDFTTANTKLGEAETALKGVPTEAAKTDGKDTGWKIGFSPPSGCTNPAAFAMPKVNLVADLCRWEPQIGAFMSFVWYLLTLGSCLSMIRGAMVGGNG